MKVFDFGDNGVGAFVLETEGKIIWAGFFLTGLDGRDFNIQAEPEEGGFALFRKVGRPAVYGDTWPNSDQQRVRIGNGTISLVDGALHIDFSIQRRHTGADQVMVSPPPPPYVRINITGTRIM